MKFVGMFLLLLAVVPLSEGCYSMSSADQLAWWALESPHGSPVGEEVCHLHHVRTVEFVTRQFSGMCGRPRRSSFPYMKARIRTFPNSYWDVESCTCDAMGEIRAMVRVCPLCRETERAWRARHNLPAVEDYPLPARKTPA